MAKYMKEIKDIINSVIPLEVDNIYKNLIKSINIYSSTVETLNQEHFDIIESLESISEAKENFKKINNKQEIFEEIVKKMKSLTEPSEGMSLDFDSIINLATSAKELQKIIERKERKIEIANQDYIKNSNNMENTLNNFKETVALITKNLEQINNLNINNQKRIDRLEITDRHTKIIDKFDELSLEQKEFLKQNLIIYLNMKITAYKKAEELAQLILRSYKSREDFSMSFIDDYYLHDFNLINSANDYDISIFENIIDENMFNFEQIKEILKFNSIAMASIESFLKNGKMLDNTKLLLEYHGMGNFPNNTLINLINAYNSTSKEHSK